MTTLHRTTDTDPLTVLVHGQDTLLFPWADLLTLRDLVAAVPPTAAHDEDAPRVVVSPWAASGSTFGIALMREGLPETHWESDEWEHLGQLLHTGDPLISVSAYAAHTGQHQSRVSEQIARGELFAFLRPGVQRRKWLIPSKNKGDRNEQEIQIP
jgi:hypothetical protein